MRPTSPQHDAGIRIDPPRSLPSASATIPDATAEALPPDDPPAESSVFHGFRVAPKRRFSVTGRSPSSGVFVLPTTIAPASRSRRTWAESCAATQSGKPRLPSVVGTPSVADSRSLIPTGTPHSGRGSPTPTASASASARSPHTVTNAFRVGFERSIASSEASTSSRARTSPAGTIAAWLGSASLQNLGQHVATLPQTGAGPHFAKTRRRFDLPSPNPASTSEAG